ncbi:MAG: hypothetical protein G01um101433_376 [Parcubacteria group bacterium Gr01-1014_33]|nr:MAG: hypothetical protein G01um101433_376 [Parcubacteria group bacterium Gr01-1014_33]
MRRPYAFASALVIFPKMKILGAKHWRIFDPAYDTVPRFCTSRDSATDGVRHTSFKGKQHVCAVWWNKAKRNANLNRFDNEWNENYWFAFVRYSLHSPLFFGKGGASFSTFFIHPPSILPISCKGSERAAYFLLSSSFNSHAIWRKNLSKSNLPLVLRSTGNFCDRGRELAINKSSSVSKNSVSTFAPIV